MRLSYENLLIHLAHDYNNVLLHYSSSQSMHCNQYASYFINRKKRKREEEKKEEELREIEDVILVVLSLQNKRRRSNEMLESRPNRKGMKYEKNTLFFTDPVTGSRSKMTYKHSLWYQNYIVNAQPQKKWWRIIFRNRFQLPYDSFRELVQMCKDSPILIQWADDEKK